MRTIRPFLVGAVILVLLGGLTGAVVAQDEAADEALRPPPQRGIVYGEEDPQRQIIHAYPLAPRDASRPAVVFVHGGGFVVGSPDDYASTIPFFVDRGYVTFNVGYRLFDRETGDNAWPTPLEDVQQAVRWIRAHAAEFNVDPERICAVGHSAGGQLVGLLGTTDDPTDDDPLLSGISSRVDCVVALAGDADLLVPYEPDPDPAWDFNILTEKILGAPLAERPDLWKAASPAHNVDQETVPFLVIHDGQDRYTPVQMARNLVDALTASGRDVVYAEFADQTHMGLLTHKPAWDLIEAFLAYQLHPER